MSGLTIVMQIEDYDALIGEVERLTEVNKSLKLQIRQQPSNKKKLTWSEVKQIRDLYRKGYRVKELATIFDVASSTTSRIVRNIYFKENR
ncbi:helix-turn-helix domain-containing protein [Mycobacteroides chelonae]|uniref:helix-turn-helix domain-containing protein n=1 Tax=Mycobacteroides chelonae TaxID=1774 RepID=UPI001F20F35A|nr:helix-turn-helix domain-containing protein [Mycobacteroides chelonae]